MLSRAFVRPSAPLASRWVEYLTLHHRRFCSKNSLHPTSVISENAVLSPDVVVGPFCVVSGGTTIGEGVVLQAGVHIFGHSRIGAKCVIRSHAVIGAEADGLETTIGPGCDIGAGTVIGGGTCIGRDTRTGNNVTLTNCDVGERCYFHNGVAIGQDGFGFKHGSDGEVIKHKQEYRVQIGDNVEIGANTCVDRGSWRDTMIGSDSKLDGLVKVGHNAVIGRAVLLCGGAALGGSSSLGNRVILGGKAAVGDHTKVCDDVRIAARSGVMNDIASPGDFAGWPAVPAIQWKRQRLHLKRLGSIRKLPGKAATTCEPLTDD